MLTYQLNEVSDYFFMNPVTGQLMLIKSLSTDETQSTEYTVSLCVSAAYIRLLIILLIQLFPNTYLPDISLQNFFCP